MAVASDADSARLAPAFRSQNDKTLQGVGFVATAYTAGPESTGKSPGDPAYGITRSGTKARDGWTIAVDPDLIPLGSLVYIEGIGIRRAEDTGGAIKGARVDIFMEDLAEALHFGIQTVTVYMLEQAV